MKTALLFLLLIVCFECYSQNSQTCDSFIEELEAEIIFNEYLTDEIRGEKLRQIINKSKKQDFDKRDIFLKYARVNLVLAKDHDDNDEALYKFVELTEICDTTNQTELRVYLGSILLISSILRDNSATELSYKYIERGISLIERKKMFNYPWIKDFYNDAGVDLLFNGNLDKARTALTKALNIGSNKDHLQNAMIEYNLSFLHYELQNIDTAIIHQKNARSHFEKIKDLNSFPDAYSQYANSLGSLSIFYYSNNEIELAEKTAREAELIFKKIVQFNSHRYPHLFTLINLAIEKNDPIKISFYLNEIKIVAEKIDVGRFNFYQLLSDSYNAIDNKSEENHYLKQAYFRSQEENDELVKKLHKYNSRLQSQILQREKIRFKNEKIELKRKSLFITSIISLIFISFITILYILYIRARNKKNLLEKEKEISLIESEKNEIKTKLNESELNEKRLVMTRLASHIKLKQETESAFLQKIKELKRNKIDNIEEEISELQVKMINLISMDQDFEYHLHVNDLDQEFKVKLKNKHPELSEKELQFCSYLLLNLTAKEIGSITNQSDGAIRVYKNRLKNKLVGDLEIDLTEYLNNILTGEFII